LLSTAFFGGVVILTSVLTAIAGLVVARRRIPLSVRERHTAAIGTIYAAVYVLFSLSAGFSLFSVWQQFQTARQTTEAEASSVETIYHLGGGLPEPGRGQVQQLAESYARAVVEEEWPLLEQAQSSPRAETLLDELRRSVQEVEPATDAQGALRTQALAELAELEEDRVLRLVLVREGLPYILWVVLVVGGILTVVFPYLFGIDAAWLHAATVGGLTVLVALVLYVIGVLDYPFGSDVGVQPEAFEVVLRAIGGNGRGP
jgi:Protein of unknown function (DUF4239)